MSPCVSLTKRWEEHVVILFIKIGQYFDYYHSWPPMSPMSPMLPMFYE